MDAIDVVLTEFDNEKIRDICSLSIPYGVSEKQKIDYLRKITVEQKIPAQELIKNAFFIETHKQYIEGVASAVNELCRRNNIAKKSIDAIGFHGKTLDHNPPSLAKINKTRPFTTQMGSAQLLANMTGIPVINDFRSDLLINGFEGAPLAAPHNAHISHQEGDGCYINSGNTSNLAWIKDGKAQISWDAGPFNEYPDNFVLCIKNAPFDKNAQWGQKGKLLPALWQNLFNLGRNYYELTPPKSGDPAFYKTSELFSKVKTFYGDAAQNEQIFCDILHTLEFFSGYLAAYAAASTPDNIDISSNFILFGGGWKNPIARQSFEKILLAEIQVLPEHQNLFSAFYKRLKTTPRIKYSDFGEFMEARLFADLARYYLEQKTWELPELQNYNKHLILGHIHYPYAAEVDDYLSKAAGGWQDLINL